MWRLVVACGGRTADSKELVILEKRAENCFLTISPMRVVPDDSHDRELGDSFCPLEMRKPARRDCCSACDEAQQLGTVVVVPRLDNGPEMLDGLMLGVVSCIPAVFPFSRAQHLGRIQSARTACVVGMGPPILNIQRRYPA